MRSVSGRVLSTEAVITVRSRSQVLSALLEVQDQQIAGIESKLVPTNLFWGYKTRSTILTFGDQSRWLITTGPPDEPRRTKRLMGISSRAGIHDRVVRVTEGSNGRLLAEATWPGRKLQKQMMRESMALHGPNPLERIVGPVLRFLTEAPRITVGDETRWLLPVEIPGRFLYGSRLGKNLTVLSERKSVRLIPDTPVPLEAAALCWHIQIGDFQIRWFGRGG